MDKILIILKKETITLYDIDSDKAAVHTISGEEVTDAEDYELVAEALRENYNDDELENLSVDVVYSVCDTEMIKSFTEELLPCGGWQVFEFKKILPEILLKNGMLKPDTDVEIAFDGDAYKVSMSKDGEISIAEAEDGTTISDTDIAAIYRGKFNVFIDNVKNSKLQQSNQELKEQFKSLNKKLTEQDNIISKIEKELANKIVEFSELNKRCKKLISQIGKRKEDGNEVKINTKKTFCFLYFFSKSVGYMTPNWKKRTQVYKVEKGEVILKQGGYVLKAPQNGVLVKRMKDTASNGDCIGVIIGGIADTDNVDNGHYNKMIEARYPVKAVLPSSYGHPCVRYKHMERFKAYQDIYYDYAWLSANYAGYMYYLTPPSFENNGVIEWRNNKPAALLVPDEMSELERDAIKEGFADWINEA